MARIKKGLNDKELQILKIIKEKGGPITSSEIMKIAPEFNKNIVQPSLRTLLSLNLIRVEDTIIEVNIVSRRFVMTEDAPRILGEMFFEEYKSLENLAGKENLFAALITTDKKDKSGRITASSLRRLLDDMKEGY